MVLLVLRHTLPIIISGAGEYSITLLTVSKGGLYGFLLLGREWSNMQFVLSCSFWCWEPLVLCCLYILWLEHVLLFTVGDISRSVNFKSTNFFAKNICKSWWHYTATSNHTLPAHKIKEALSLSFEFHNLLTLLCNTLLYLPIFLTEPSHPSLHRRMGKHPRGIKGRHKPCLPFH